MSVFVKCIIGFMVFLLLPLPVSCVDSGEITSEKVSSLLLTQVSLKKEQIDNPTTERLNMMRQMGMTVDNLENQRIFIHLQRELDDSQVKELQDMGLTLYLDSWIPPVGAHPTGYIIAEMPVDVLGELAEVEYIIRLDTAEQQLQPHEGSQPGAE